MKIKEAQERVDAWIKEYGVRYFNELTNMAILTLKLSTAVQTMCIRYLALVFFRIVFVFIRTNQLLCKFGDIDAVEGTRSHHQKCGILVCQ